MYNCNYGSSSGMLWWNTVGDGDHPPGTRVEMFDLGLSSRPGQENISIAKITQTGHRQEYALTIHTHAPGQGSAVG